MKNINPLEKSYFELEKAKKFLEEMRNSKSMDEFEEAWKNYLSRLERVWYKFLAVHQKHPKWDGWGGSHIRTKKKDPLLSYLTNARGADEHNLLEIIEKSPRGMTINPASGNKLYLKNLTIKKGKLSVDSEQPVKITFIPEKIRLIPITNRGVVFPVPTSHLGNPINPEDINAVAELGIKYYEKMLDDSKNIFS